jgi:hypothetical protein
LGELHRRLETGQIDEKDFDLEESRLLEQIEELARVLHPREEPEDVDIPRRSAQASDGPGEGNCHGN